MESATHFLLEHQSVLDNSSSSSNSTINLNTIPYYGLYSILACSFSGPFIIVFGVFLIISIVSLILQRNQIRKNQLLLFVLLIFLAASAMISNSSRLAGEFSLLEPNGSTRFYANNGIKAFDRFTVSVLIFLQILILSLICNVFIDTTKATGFVSPTTYKISRVVLISNIVLIFTLLLLNNVAIWIYHGLRGTTNVLDTADEVNDFQKSIFIVPCIVFFISCIIITIMLNVYGARLSAALNKSKKKLKEIFKRQRLAMSTSPTERSSRPTSPTGTGGNNNALSNSQTQLDSDLVDVLSSNTTSLTETLSTQQIPTIEFTKEQAKTYALKKRALRRALMLQIGLSASLFLEAVGVLFISFGLFWNYILLLYHVFFNVGMVLFIVLLLVIYHPLKEVQRLFRLPSDQIVAQQKKSAAAVQPATNSQIELQKI